MQRGAGGGGQSPNRPEIKKDSEKGKEKGKEEGREKGKENMTVVAGAGAATRSSLPSTWMCCVWRGTCMHCQCHAQWHSGVSPILHATPHCAVEGQVL